MKMIIGCKCMVLMKRSKLRFQLKPNLLLKGQEQFCCLSTSLPLMWTTYRFSIFNVQNEVQMARSFDHNFSLHHLNSINNFLLLTFHVPLMGSPFCIVIFQACHTLGKRACRMTLDSFHAYVWINLLDSFQQKNWLDRMSI